MSDQSRQRVRVFEWRATDPSAQNFLACDDVVIRQAARPDEAPPLLFDALSCHGPALPFAAPIGISPPSTVELRPDVVELDVSDASPCPDADECCVAVFQDWSQRHDEYFPVNTVLTHRRVATIGENDLRGSPALLVNPLLAAKSAKFRAPSIPEPAKINDAHVQEQLNPDSASNDKLSNLPERTVIPETEGSDLGSDNDMPDLDDDAESVEHGEESKPDVEAVVDSRENCGASNSHEETAAEQQMEVSFELQADAAEPETTVFLSMPSPVQRMSPILHSSPSSNKPMAFDYNLSQFSQLSPPLQVVLPVTPSIIGRLSHPISKPVTATPSADNISTPFTSKPKGDSNFSQLPSNTKPREADLSNRLTTGFASASGKAVTITAASLARSQKLLGDEISSSVSESTTTATGFPAASGKAVSVSAETIQRSMTLLKDAPVTANEVSPVTTVFSTASGKSLSVSAQSMQRGSALFKDDDGLYSAASTNVVEPNIATHSNNANQFESGFSTALGRAVKISAESVFRARQMFDDESPISPLLNGDSSTSLSNQIVSGFSTASGRALSINSDSLNKAKALFRTEDAHVEMPDATPAAQPLSSSGFATASGKAMSISSESIIKAKKFFDDDFDSNSAASPAFESTGFQTGSGKQVTINAASAAKFGSFFGEDDDSALKADVPKSALKRPAALITESLPAAPSEFATPRSTVQFAVPKAKAQATPTSTVKLASGQKPYKTPRFVAKPLVQVPATASTAQLPTKVLASPVAPLVVVAAANPNSHPSLLGTSFASLTPFKTKSALSLTPSVKDSSFSSENSIVEPPSPAHSKGTKLSNAFDSMRPSVVSLSPATRILSPANVFQLVFPVVTSTGLLEPEKISLFGVHTLLADLSGIGCPVHLIPKITSQIAPKAVIDTPSAYAYDLRGYLAAEPITSGLAWLDNHFKWICWKLAALDRFVASNQSSQNSHLYLTYPNIIQQLSHRVHKELELCHRPCLALILERDSAPSRFMVLCVANIQREKSTDNIKLELTDGWYSIETVIDRHLAEVVRAGKIAIGKKLSICMAELVGGSDGIAPLENSSCMLRIHYNSTRRAERTAKLGFQVRPLFHVSLASLKPDGGPAPAIRAIVVRRYPLTFMETREDGSKAFRNEKGEEKCQLDLQRHHQHDTASQRDNETDMMVDSKSGERNVMPFMRCALMDVSPDFCFRCSESTHNSKLCSFTIWRCDDSHSELFSEGQALEIRHLSASQKMLSDDSKSFQRSDHTLSTLIGGLSLSSGKTTSYQLLSTNSVCNKCRNRAIFPTSWALSTPIARRPLDTDRLFVLPLFSEFDVTAVLLHIENVVDDALKQRVETKLILHCLTLGRRLLRIEVTESDSTIHFTSRPKCPVVLTALNLKYRRNENDILVAMSSEHSIFIVGRSLSKVELPYLCLKTTQHRDQTSATGSASVRQSVNPTKPQNCFASVFDVLHSLISADETSWLHQQAALARASSVEANEEEAYYRKIFEAFPQMEPCRKNLSGMLLLAFTEFLVAAPDSGQQSEDDQFLRVGVECDSCVQPCLIPFPDFRRFLSTRTTAPANSFARPLRQLLGENVFECSFGFCGQRMVSECCEHVRGLSGFSQTVVVSSSSRITQIAERRSGVWNRLTHGLNNNIQSVVDSICKLLRCALIVTDDSWQQLEKSDVAEADGDVIYAWLIDSIQARDGVAHCAREDVLLFHPSEWMQFRLAISEVLGVDSYQLSICALMQLPAHATKVYGVNAISPIPLADNCTVLAAAARSRLQVRLM